MKLSACPKCGCETIYVDRISLAVDFDGHQFFGGKRIETYCNMPYCDQRFWYYPATGRITRRNVGAVSRHYRKSKEAR